MSHTEIQAHTTNTTGLMATPCMLGDPQHSRVDTPLSAETRLTYQAAALYIATSAYTEALAMPNPAATLDDMADALPAIMPSIARVTDAGTEFAETLRAAIADRLWAFTAIEHGRAEIGDGFGYVFDLMADNLKRGTDPAFVRAEVTRVTKLLRIENAIATATDAIRAAMTMALAGLTTNPRDTANLLHTAIDDAQSEHLASLGVSLEEAESSEAHATATYAMARAVELSPDPKGTARALRSALRMVIDEAGVPA